MNYTKGPWGASQIGNCTGWSVASISEDSYDVVFDTDDIRQADLNLIIAAPNMFELLCDIITDHRADIKDALVREIRTAILQASGVQL